ncbi:hypothetical protein GNI_173900 [Gregarina niphandrodes]|uniref:Uncharacterized protein n=1 Tax=Gregarina niphandrodes TaxID=110365 RepID=A0A023AXM7_GRENI|nr:hypothetical protein GNI_173900 [Gregarina niphandrodes]EZG43397.1 hypothetical protein GNI_173900 [Gregarina niphandrodes]|eukprot:XP_011133374.1 hypothetical protein GNI_173900 [Gregarina niphandrodes]
MAPPEVDLRAFVPMESQREERTPARPVGGGGDEFSRDASSREEEASRQQELLGEQLRLQEANLQEMRDQEMRMQELSRQLQAEREELELLRRQPLQPEEPDVQPDEETAPAKPSFLRRCVNLLACGAGKKRSESEEAHAEGDPQEHNSDEDSEGPDVHDLRPVGNADWVNSRTPRIT